MADLRRTDSVVQGEAAGVVADVVRAAHPVLPVATSKSGPTEPHGLPGVAFTPRQPVFVAASPLLVWILFLLLCGITASLWLLPADPNPTSRWTQPIASALAGFTALASRPRSSRSHRCGSLLQTALAGLFLLGLPAILLDHAQAVPSIERVALFAAIPIFIVMGGSHSEQPGASTPDGRYLLPAVAGFGGLFLVLPVEFPGSLSAAIALWPVLAAAISVALASLWLPRQLRLSNLRSTLPAIFLPNALLLSGYALLAEPGRRPASIYDLESAATSLAQLLLLLWLIREMAPRRLAARFLIVPLLTTIEGLAILHGDLTLRLLAGTLITAAAAYLLLARPAETIAALSLR